MSTSISNDRSITGLQGLPLLPLGPADPRTVGRLLAAVAHEMKNPLAAVLLNLDVAMEQAAKLMTPGGTRSLEGLQEILRDAKGAMMQVNRIVQALGNPVRSADRVRPVANLRNVVDAVIRMTALEARDRARLVVDFRPVPDIAADETALVQVMLNLVRNAIQAVPAGRPDTNIITIAVRRDGQARVVVEVTDTGMGMPGDTLAQCFSPAFSTKPDGSGLGLAICDRIITDLGGTISAESTAGTGTTVLIVLPACDVVAGHHASRRHEGGA